MDLKHRKKIKHFYNGADSFGADKQLNYPTYYNRGISLAPYGYSMNIPQTISTPSVQTSSSQPTTSTKGNFTWDKAGNIATSLVNHVGAVHNAFTLDRSEGEIEAAAGSRNINAGGWAWQKLNDVNRSKELSELNKLNTSNTLATTGSGAALGAVF